MLLETELTLETAAVDTEQVLHSVIILIIKCICPCNSVCMDFYDIFMTLFQ